MNFNWTVAISTFAVVILVVAALTPINLTWDRFGPTAASVVAGLFAAIVAGVFA